MVKVAGWMCNVNNSNLLSYTVLYKSPGVLLHPNLGLPPKILHLSINPFNAIRSVIHSAIEVHGEHVLWASFFPRIAIT